MRDAASHPGRRPRPVAGLPQPQAAELAKAWLLALMARTAPEDLAAVPVALLTREGPGLCAAVVAAVGADAALERLLGDARAPGPAARAGVLAGARDPAAVIAAVEALRAVVHRALRTDEDAALAGDTGDRLAYVCAGVAGACVPAGGSAVAPREDPPPRLTAQDLRRPAAPLPALTRVLADPGTRPVAVLVVELDDRERLVAVEGEAALAAALAPLESALVPPPGSGAASGSEAPGRWWLVVPGTGTAAARELARARAEVVRAHAPVRHGAPLSVSIGIAVAPDDGSDAQALLDHADEGVFTARALGVPVA